MYDFLVEEEVIVEGHFVLRSGRHAQQYIEKTKIFNEPLWIYSIAKTLADKFISHLNIDVIAGPESGGAKLAKEVAKEVNDIPSVGLAKKEGDYEFFVQPDDIATVKGKNVVIVDDIVVTGGSFRGSIKAVQDVGGNVLAALAMIKRSPEPINLGEGIIFATTAICELPDYPADDCPLCDWGLPITPKPQKNPS